MEFVNAARIERLEKLVRILIDFCWKDLPEEEQKKLMQLI